MCSPYDTLNLHPETTGRFAKKIVNQWYCIETLNLVNAYVGFSDRSAFRKFTWLRTDLYSATSIS